VAGTQRGIDLVFHLLLDVGDPVWMAERLHTLRTALDRTGAPLRLRPVHSGMHAVADLEEVDAERVFIARQIIPDVLSNPVPPDRLYIERIAAEPSHETDYHCVCKVTRSGPGARA
jgi:hypothetical protein